MHGAPVTAVSKLLTLAAWDWVFEASVEVLAPPRALCVIHQQLWCCGTHLLQGKTVNGIAVLDSHLRHKGVIDCQHMGWVNHVAPMGNSDDVAICTSSGLYVADKFGTYYVVLTCTMTAAVYNRNPKFYRASCPRIKVFCSCNQHE